MGYLVLKRDHEVDLIPKSEFSRENQERDLHQLLKTHPELLENLLFEESSTRVKLLGSEIRLPSGGRLDLLFITSEGKLILVELKRNKTHREAIGQLLDYASDIQSLSFEELMEKTQNSVETPEDLFRNLFGELFEESDDAINTFTQNVLRAMTNPQELKLLLVSYSAGDDVLRIVEWLRKVGIDINAIEFDYFKQDKLEAFVPRLIFPEISERKSIHTPTEPNPYKLFFDSVISEFKEQKPGVTDRRARNDPYLEVPLGHWGVHLKWRFKGPKHSKILKVGLVIDPENPQKMEVFNALLAMKERIEAELRSKGIIEEIKWESPSYNPCIYVEKKAGDLKTLPDNEELQKWAVERMIAFYEVLKPIIDEIFQKMNELTEN